MRHTATGSSSHVRPLVALVLVALAALLTAGTALAASPGPQESAPSATPVLQASGDPSPSPSPSPTVEPTLVTCALSRPSVVYGGELSVSGTVTPAVAGQPVVIAFDGVDKVTEQTGADGAYSVTISPRRSVAVTARAADGTTSAPAELTVRPAVTLSHAAVVPFLPLKYTLRVLPAGYDGLVTARVTHRGSVVATVQARARDGKAVLSVPVRGIDWFTLRFTLTPAAGLGSRTLQSSVKAEWRTLSAGSTGPRVRGLLTALSRLKIRVPGIGTTFTSACRDSVVAFQKAYGLPRTYVVDHDDWRKLDGAAPRKPRYSSPSTHIEVDKTRQILLVVKAGKLAGLIPVSTGATGNTPEGAFSVLRKSVATTPLYGSGTLPWVMGFVGDFAIHGYPDVPPYPASHGCIREPLWVCRWTYDQSFVGERLYVYH